MSGRAAERAALIEGLRGLAAFYSRSPAAYYDGTRFSLSIYLPGGNARPIMTDMALLFGAHEEILDEKYVAVRKNFSRNVTLELFALRSALCRGVLLGKRREGEMVIQPAQGISGRKPS